MTRVAFTPVTAASQQEANRLHLAEKSRGWAVAPYEPQSTYDRQTWDRASRNGGQKPAGQTA
jgi:hypothetical protein